VKAAQHRIVSINSKESWQTIHELLNRKSKTTAINEINMNGKTIVGDEEIAKEFNKYFSEVGKKLAEEIPDNDIDPLHYVNPVQSNSFTFKTISEEDLNRIISSMKTCKSAGIDKISVKLIQAAGKTILKSLKNIFNLSLNTGIFPDDWKIARVITCVYSRRYSRARENGKLEIPPAQKLHILSSAHRTNGSAHLTVKPDVLFPECCNIVGNIAILIARLL
jgi:hypothetical protein